MTIIISIVLATTIVGLLYTLYVDNKPYKRVKQDMKIAYEIGLHKLEMIEIAKHKWLESEKAGHDIGMKKAQESWDKNHAKQWRNAKQIK